MLGSLTFYRRLLLENFYTTPSVLVTPSQIDRVTIAGEKVASKLPALGHAIAGVMAGATVSFIAAPVEHIKARLQIQYAADKTKRLYSGPVDCSRKIVRHPHCALLKSAMLITIREQYRVHGIRGLYHGLSATLLFRSFFFFWWGSYDILSRFLSTSTSLSTPAINFWAGGLSAQVFWIMSYPSDVVKQRIMTDPLGKGLGDGERMFPRWKDAARLIWKRDGVRGYWRGFVPCFLRAFPANAMALMTFEGVMRALPE